MPVTFADVVALPVSAAPERHRYGDAPSQFGELWLPQASGSPSPVVVLIHGGCWLADYDLAYVRPLAVALRNRGYAVWAPDGSNFRTGGELAPEGAAPPLGLRARGYRFAIVDLTAGERGSRGDRETRAAEAKRAADLLGASARECLGLPDTQLSPTHGAVRLAVETLRKWQPRLVVGFVER